MSAVRGPVSLWLAGTASALLAAWLLLPAVPEAARRPALDAVLVDASLSETRVPGWIAWVRDELGAAARTARAEAAELVVVAFAEGVATGFGPGDPEAFLAALEGRQGRPFDPRMGLGGGASRLADGLATLEPLLADRGRPPGRLLLLAPPRCTGDDPAAALARLRAQGVALAARAVPPPAPGDLGVLALRLAPRVEPGAPLVAVAELVLERGSAPRASAMLEIEHVTETGAARTTRALALPSADGPFECALACGRADAGWNEVRLRVRLTEGPDRFPENDTGRARTRADGSRVLGVVAREEQRAAARAWLAPAGTSTLTGLQFDFLEPDALAHALEGCDALVTFDLGTGDLPDALLRDYLLRGGGWLALSGPRFLADWIPGEEPQGVARLLPCVPRSGAPEPRDVVLLLDGSGSMEGEPFETVRTAALELISSALPSDRVSLRFFTTRLEREHVLKERSATRAADSEAARRAARDLLALRVPSGTTFLLSSLREFGASAGRNETLALLLTDGNERDSLPDPQGLAREVAAELAARRVRLVVLAVGHADLALLAALAGGPEEVRSGQTLDELREVFQREMHGAQLAVGRLELGRGPHPEGSLATEIEGPRPSAELPPLAQYVRNRLSPGAEALWTGEEGDAVLAVARAGLGRTALFASLPGGRWAPDYARPGLGQPAEFEALLRWIARGPERRPLPRARLEGATLRVSGLGADTPAQVPARVLGPGGAREAEALLFVPSSPGLDPFTTREADGVPELGPAACFLELEEGAAGPRVLPLERAPSDELAWRTRTVALTGHASGARGPAEPEGGSGSRRSAPWVLALALALLFLAGLASARGQGLPGFGR